MSVAEEVTLDLAVGTGTYLLGVIEVVTANAKCFVKNNVTRPRRCYSYSVDHWASFP